jgi:threonylcarbamoyladenosine tRNA methylthiotransferase MtaB
VNVFLDSIGCRLNQSEIEQYARQLRMAGHILVGEAGQADMVIVNTCAVTEAATSDSRQKIRQASRAGAGQIVVTGCWSTLEPEQAASLPGVSQVVPNAVKDQLVPQILQVDANLFDREFIEREPVPGLRMRTRAFIKVQDGCENRCTFCVTTLARGESRSRPVREVIADIRAAIAGGAQEVILTGVHLGSWGQERVPAQRLKDLVKAVLETCDLTRLRLSSLEPWDLDPDFFSLWQDARLCRHLHLPLQSGSAATLRRMARKTTPAAYADLVSAARQAIPGVAVTTDIIVGFPGESEAEFEECLAFTRSMEFAGGHVFSYSTRPGTAAARMPGKVPAAVRKTRSSQLRAVLEESARRYQEQFLGQELGVLWENAASFGPQGWKVSGLTDNYLRVVSFAPRQMWNHITPVKLESVSAEGLQGTLILADPISQDRGSE